jgi:hypothetical protein
LYYFYFEDIYLLFLGEPTTDYPPTFYGAGNNAPACQFTQNPAAKSQWASRVQSEQKFWENTGNCLNFCTSKLAF